MTRRAKILAIAGLLLVVEAGLVTVGWVAEHNRDVAAAERGERPDQDDDSSSGIAALVVIFAALVAASQARKSNKDDKPDG